MTPVPSAGRPAPRFVVFDLDGTLIDSRRDLADAANETLVAGGARSLPQEAIVGMVGDGAATLVARAFAAAGVAPPADALDRFLRFYDARLLHHTVAYPGIPEVLAELAGRATLAVLTNKPVGPTWRILDGLDLARHFPPDQVLGGDGPLPRKPDPTGLRVLMERAGVGPEATVLVGDSAVDWRTAQNARVAACLTRYGFGWAGLAAGELGPLDWIVDSPSELLSRL